MIAIRPFGPDDSATQTHALPPGGGFDAFRQPKLPGARNANGEPRKAIVYVRSPAFHTGPTTLTAGPDFSVGSELGVASGVGVAAVSSSVGVGGAELVWSATGFFS